MNLIDTIENLCNESNESPATILAKIKTAIQNEKFPSLSKVADGEHFFYNGIEFIRLGLEQGGVLAITANIAGEAPFDTNGCNNWRKSSLRKKLNDEFLTKLNDDDLLPFTSDLTADNGDTAYGDCTDKVGVLSCDLYRKYRKFVPLFGEWMWTCTPWYCDDSGYAGIVRGVGSDGTVDVINADISCGFAPACIFTIQNQ